MFKGIANKHANCDVVINWGYTNQNGSPALCCAVHKDKRGRLQWLDWCSKQDIHNLKQLGVPEITPEIADILHK